MKNKFPLIVFLIFGFAILWQEGPNIWSDLHRAWVRNRHLSKQITEVQRTLDRLGPLTWQGNQELIERPAESCLFWITGKGLFDVPDAENAGGGNMMKKGLGSGDTVRSVVIIQLQKAEPESWEFDQYQENHDAGQPEPRYKRAGKKTKIVPTFTAKVYVVDVESNKVIARKEFTPGSLPSPPENLGFIEIFHLKPQGLSEPDISYRVVNEVWRWIYPPTTDPPKK